PGARAAAAIEIKRRRPVRRPPGRLAHSSNPSTHGTCRSATNWPATVQIVAGVALAADEPAVPAVRRP
ncbi:MAG: hypothetical protein ACRDNS_10905, partial [Trebonia sp.]